MREAIGAADFERAFAEGASYTVEQAVALALGEDSGPADGTAAAGHHLADGFGGLTRRQLEIAGLLAEGLTNREIATRLVISPRTAETHVDHILTRLGMTSRAQVASWVAEREAR